MGDLMHLPNIFDDFLLSFLVVEIVVAGYAAHYSVKQFRQRGHWGGAAAQSAVFLFVMSIAAGMMMAVVGWVGAFLLEQIVDATVKSMGGDAPSWAASNVELMSAIMTVAILGAVVSAVIQSSDKLWLLAESSLKRSK